ncbi:hypothetical protein OBBRIDRAFT_357812 [Obba rivulosa]|uniref:F-box domain-containing protein n=1 Tax=Obba rivulosa TaxID=1052685 RepID=A0A8E2AIP4_9APHY|nr:hypothetical protein OBBRIDRAFT_357812 [Obba rivulosa]
MITGPSYAIPEIGSVTLKLLRRHRYPGSAVVGADMKLTFDCLFAVVPQLSSRSDVLSMALTCRTVYAYAIEHIRLWRVHVEESIALSVRKDLYVDFPSRLRLVRELTLPHFPRNVDLILQAGDSRKTVQIAADNII